MALAQEQNLSTYKSTMISMSKGKDIVLDVDSSGSFLVNEIDCGSHLVLNVKNDVSVRFSVLAKNNIDNANITVNLEKNASFDAYFADFSQDKGKVKVLINLNNEGANAIWHLASLSANSDNKEFEVSIFHNAPRTFGRSDNFGVCKDDAKLIFSGVSKIFNGNKKSKTNQNAKIMVFDKASNAVAKPILQIDENDIEASHAAIVGKINDEHLFYLTSRGLTDAEAKELITFGYLKPILNGFDDENIKEEITELIEGRM
ncbi:MAG: SufD family Fe-S cluster assembly protein [Bacilli bacterium]|nr:SufD family Fe-S cluster assembly protein [Bacilli bacterium]